ncbi:NADH-Ubiquinone/plastoquinone (complex I), various chains family protein [Mycobacterium xenopi 3993]|nr:NADH-Ubiquinone/plastoquinone (complex I), various chains family protein [Mycobacterium xenopi 3993]
MIITTDNFFVLLFGWETLTIAFYLLAGYDRGLPGRMEASVITVVFGKASGAAVLLGALLLAGRTHTFVFTASAVDPRSVAGQTAYALLLLGFGIKVGLVPAHIWMPRGYAAARPSTCRDGRCGRQRRLLRNVAHTERAGSATGLAGLRGAGRRGATAILGIAHAAVNADLAALISWSSVENAGLITAGYGVALMGPRQVSRD